MDTKTKYLLIVIALLAAGGGYWWFTKKSSSSTSDQAQETAVDQSLANYQVPPSIGAQTVVGDPYGAQNYGGIPIGGTVQQKQTNPLPYNT